MCDGSPCLLIVEDDSDARENLHALLERGGWRIDEAMVAEALDREDWSAYSAILPSSRLRVLWVIDLGNPIVDHRG